MTVDIRSDRLARVWEKHRKLRTELRNLTEATEALELRGEVDGVARQVSWLAREGLEHLPEEEALAAQVAGGEAPAVISLVSEHRDLRERLARLEALLARVGNQDVRDELWRESSAAIRALSCHVCRQEHGLLPLLQLAGEGGLIPSARMRPPCHRC